jgi:glutathione S-transferase
MTSTSQPSRHEHAVLWHLKVSNYNEKARWALDFKGVPHVRRAVDPGPHRAIARKLTGGTTFPVLVLDGEAIGDSTRIIEALERRHPEPPLYSADREARGRALELAAWFDTELGPAVRLLAVHHMLADPQLLLTTFAPDLSRGRKAVARALFPLVKRRVIADLGIDGLALHEAYRRIDEAGERFQQALRPSGYLLGDRFGVADLTLAALVAPVVAPEQFPYTQPQRGHALLDSPRTALAATGILEWTRRMYALHRGSGLIAPVGRERPAAARRRPPDRAPAGPRAAAR